MIGLKCLVQNYPWGKIGEESAAGSLKKAVDPDFELDGKHCAELWMGTHPSGPSKVDEEDNQEAFLDWIRKNPAGVGQVPADYPGDDLPFLFKVLSIRTALSIQAHPDKPLAQILFQKYPDIYKDGNHKPEMCVALTKFEALSGFRSLSEIKVLMKAFPEFSIPENLHHNPTVFHGDDMEMYVVDQLTDHDQIKKFFKSFMTLPDVVANEQICKLITRLKHERDNEPEKFNNNHLNELLIRLNEQYPNDKGIFCPIIFNYIVLQKGESFFMAANEPHAYISGDCVECMALSDNVVRAGLTPKYKDVQTLCSMLTYKSGPVNMIIPTDIDECTRLYRPPVAICSEFEVELTNVTPDRKYTLPKVDCGCIVVVMEGSCDACITEVFRTSRTKRTTEKMFCRGMVIFQSADTELIIDTLASTTGVLLFRAHVNLGSRGSDVAGLRRAFDNDHMWMYGHSDEYELRPSPLTPTREAKSLYPDASPS